MEIKNLNPQTVKIKRNEDNSLTVEGYAAVYNVDSKPLNVNGKMVIERILSDAFGEVVRNLDGQSKDCVATVNHNRDVVMARSSSGTLQLSSDEVGLHFSYNVPDTSAGKDLTIQLERGDLKNCSFVGLAKSKDVILYRGEDGNYRQDIKAIYALHDVSVVVDSQYEQASVDRISRGLSELETEELAETERLAEIQRNLEQENALKESQLDMLNNLITRAEL